MARNTQPPAPRPANLSIEQMKEATPRIRRRIAEVEQSDPDSVQDWSDLRIKALENKLEALLMKVFGDDTIEFRRYRRDAADIDRAPLIMGGTAIYRVREGLNEGKNAVLHHLRDIIPTFDEEIGDSGVTTTGKALKAYEALELHPEIERAAGRPYRDGHFANAIEDSVKALNALVRLRSGEEKDGRSLMDSVFNHKTLSSSSIL